MDPPTDDPTWHGIVTFYDVTAFIIKSEDEDMCIPRGRTRTEREFSISEKEGIAYAL
jgi:hypothetical protein